ncbi:cache domain-containing protein, partial [Campylobacter sp. IFREMER_LSEM_CL1085]|uniref:cache domain-containing protein n=2 Tax=unclassified Campylobacter TaxID=2593542 RepID=UPI0021E66AE8
MTSIVGLLIITILSIVSILGYFQTKNNTFELIKDVQLKTMDDVTLTFNNYGQSKRNAINTLASELSKAPLDDREQILSLISSFQKAFNFQLTFFGIEELNGVFLSNGKFLNPENGFNLQNSIWYTQAKQAKTVITTNPYKSSTDNTVTMTYAAPVYKNGKFIGVVGGDYALSSFSKDVLAFGRSATTYAVVYNNEGEIMFHENQDKILTKDQLGINISKIINTNPSYYLDPDNRDSLFQVQDDKNTLYEVMCNSTINQNFKVCTITENRAYTNPIKKALSAQIIVGLIAIAVALLVVKLVIQYNLSPLQKIQTGLNSFFDFINHKTKDSAMIDVKTNDEFGVM